MVAKRLVLGVGPKPTVERTTITQRGTAPVVPIRAVQPRTELSRPVRIDRVVRETDEAVSVFVSEHDGSPIDFVPGQFLSVDVTVDGQRLRRAYSLANASGTPTYVTIKKMPGGRVSGWLNDNAKAGDMLQVLGPSGAFTTQTLPKDVDHLVMIAGGSGITPIISIAESTLQTEPNRKVTLIYGNRSRPAIIFYERLQKLTGAYPERFAVDHVVETLLDAPTLQARLDALVASERNDVAYYVCGPTPMMDAARRVFADMGIDAGRVFEERFSQPEARGVAKGSAKKEMVTVMIDGQQHQIGVAPGQTVLQAAGSAGVALPFSCAMGGCGACKLHRVKGDYVMDEPNCLTDAEKQQGYVLTCVGKPLSAVTLEQPK